VPGFGFDNWYALFLPGATDKALAVKIQETVSRILLEPDTKKLLLGQGLDAVGSSQDEFAKMYEREIATWAKVVKTIGLQPN
jgi:tripartite-type tricarboxylate transporter receptor subunit TctC